MALHFVPDGVYDRGGRRCNAREAEAVVDLVFEHFATRGDRSLGVIAFSLAQAEAIEDAIERRRARRPEFEAFFSGDRLDGFFVKNLENVQGDERDDIILSVGYGRDARGVLTMNFGPLNGAGGERRLNVAITRAMDRVTLVSSTRATRRVDRRRAGGGRNAACQTVPGWFSGQAVRLPKERRFAATGGCAANAWVGASCCRRWDDPWGMLRESPDLFTEDFRADRDQGAVQAREAHG